MADRYMDFDAAVIEEGKPPVTFTIGGRHYELPADLPAKVVLVQMRSTDSEGQVSGNIMSDWLEALVGTKNLELMYEDNVTWPQMEKLLSNLMVEYGLKSDDDEDEDSEDEEDPN